MHCCNVPFSSGDKALIKNLYQFKKYSFRRIMTEFLKINCNRESVGMLLTLILVTCSTNQRHETGRLKHTRTEENVITADEMVGLLNHKGQKQTYHSIHQISKETDLTRCSIVEIIQCIFGQKCIFSTNMLAVYYCSVDNTWPETGGTCCLVPETMTQLAGKWYWQKKKQMDSDFTEISFSRIVLWAEKTFVTPLCLLFLFANKRAVLSSAQTDQSQFSFLVGFWHEIYHALTGTGFWHQKSMTDWPVSGTSWLVPETGAWNWPVCHHF